MKIDLVSNDRVSTIGTLRLHDGVVVPESKAPIFDSLTTKVFVGNREYTALDGIDYLQAVVLAFRLSSHVHSIIEPEDTWYLGEVQKSLNPPLYFGKSAMVQRLVDVKGPRGSYRARRWVNPDLWQKDQVRADLARLHTPITDKTVRDIATKWEKEIAAIIPGAMWHGKNLPYDIVTPKSLIEVKAIVSPKTFRLNVNKDEILKKKKFREIHGQKRKKEFIIGLDLRVNPKEPTVYMHNSVGAWRLGGKGQKMKQYTWAEFQRIGKTL